MSLTITRMHYQRFSGSSGRTLNFSNTRGCHQWFCSRRVLNNTYANRRRGGSRGVISKHWLRASHSLPLALLARFARVHSNPTSRIFKSSFWPSGLLRSLLNIIVLGLAVHRWRRKLRWRLGAQSAKNIPLINTSLSLRLGARNIACSGSSLGTKETGVVIST